MTTRTFGVDISAYQRGLPVERLRSEGYTFVIAKATEGAGYQDPCYPHFRDAALGSGLLFAAYHLLRSDSSAPSQARNIAAWVGDRRIPLMIDVEPSGPSRPTLAQAIDFTRACQQLGLRLTMLYLNLSYWRELGRPSLPGSFALVRPDYGANPAGYGSVIYPGDDSPRWAGFGGDTVSILQCGSRGRLSCYPGKDVDIDVFRGTPQQLSTSGVFFVPQPSQPR